MFMTSSAFFAVNLARCLTSLRSWKKSTRQNSQILDSSQKLYNRLELVEDILYPINFFFSDAVVVWRAWVIVHKKSRLILSVLLVGTAASVILLMIGDILPSSLENNTALNVVVPIPLVLTNLSATWMIGWKFWSTRKLLKPHILRESSGTWTGIERIFLIILESGFLYLIVWVFSAIAISGAFGGTAGDLKDAFLPHLAAIYLPLVFLLVAGQKSQVNAVLQHEDNMELTEVVSMETIATEFAHSRSTPIDTTTEEDKPNDRVMDETIWRVGSMSVRIWV
ncbi:hypothetical protein K435DRAFT_854424 [Dendrothele bispora CBS 962.96]|uniref:Uncharacterized protein n=1 Tax=Dendrothele bispora (strain CBS 962.96) TaxID=1314807 RepID=A0A4S8MDV0_DENBC|nr:hypothetical protein K435DRAFT_854424 [Dendrothele bispora CBS 962.96]